MVKHATYFGDVCVYVCVCMCTHKVGLNYRPMHWPAINHLDLCYLMLSKVDLIKGIIVFRREAIVTFEPNNSHYPSCSAIPRDNGEQMMLLHPSFSGIL